MSVMMIQSGRFSSAAFTPLDLSPALWIDPSDASTVTISGSSGAYIGANGLVLPFGVSSNAAQTPDSAALSITGDLDLIVKATAANWNPGAVNQTLISKDGGTPGMAWQINSLGQVTVYWRDSGGTLRQGTSSVATGLAAGATKWLRATVDVDNGASGTDVKFYLSDDGSSWTQLGTTAVIAAVTNIRDDTNALQVGARNSTETFGGTIHRAIIKNGIGGTTVFDADFENATPFVSAFTESALGAPVYVVSSTATSATANYSYIGPNGLMQSSTTGNLASTPSTASLQMSGATGIDLIAKVTLPVWTGTAAHQTIIAKGDPYVLRISTGGLLNAVFYSTAPAYKEGLSTVSIGVSAGATKWVRATCDFTTGDLKFYTSDDGTSWTQLGATVSLGAFTLNTSAAALNIGCYASGTQHVQNGTIHRAIVKNGIDGTVVFDADFTTAADYASTFVESSSNAATVTITATNTPANAAGALVSQIDDKSGNARHLSQGTAANMPKYWNGRNGLNCLVFDGTSDLMDFDAGSDALAFGSGWVAFTAARNGDTLPLGASEFRRALSTRRSATGTADSADAVPFYLTATGGQLSAASTGTLTGTTGSVVGNVWFQGTSVQESTNLRTRKDGSASSNTVVAAAGTLRYVRLGAGCSSTSNPPGLTAAETWQGEIGETILVLGSVADPTVCEGYIKPKWGTP